MKDDIRYRLLCLALGSFLVGSVIGCATNNHYKAGHEPITPTPMEEAMFEGMADTVVPENIGETMLESLETKDSVPFGHMTGGAVPQKPVK